MAPRQRLILRGGSLSWLLLFMAPTAPAALITRSGPKLELTRNIPESEVAKQMGEHTMAATKGAGYTQQRKDTKDDEMVRLPTEMLKQLDERRKEAAETAKATLKNDAELLKAAADDAHKTTKALSTDDAKATDHAQENIIDRGAVTVKLNKDSKAKKVEGNMAVKVAPIDSKLVWMLGCSIDSRALEEACNRSGAPIQSNPLHVGTQWVDRKSQWCTFDGITLFYTFHQGATPGPYWDWFNYSAETGGVTTAEVVKSAVEFIEATFGKLPDVVIVDSSLWDVANWWQNDGKPAVWAWPQADIDLWASTTISNFLGGVQALVPNGRVALRSPTPVFDSSPCPATFGYICYGAEGSVRMYTALKAQATGNLTHQLYGKYPLLDYRMLASSIMQSWPGCVAAPTAPTACGFTDTVHPATYLAGPYMAAVVEFGKGNGAIPAVLQLPAQAAAILQPASSSVVQAHPGDMSKDTHNVAHAHPGLPRDMMPSDEAAPHAQPAHSSAKRLQARADIELPPRPQVVHLTDDYHHP